MSCGYIFFSMPKIEWEKNGCPKCRQPFPIMEHTQFPSWELGKCFRNGLKQH